MLLDLNEYKRQCFKQLAQKIVANPDLYLTFDSVADFYQATWLDEFPKGTTWMATGLDDGAEEFFALVEYQTLYLKIICQTQCTVDWGER